MNPALRSPMSGLLMLIVLTGIGFRFYHLDPFLPCGFCPRC